METNEKALCIGPWASLFLREMAIVAVLLSVYNLNIQVESLWHMWEAEVEVGRVPDIKDRWVW